MGRFSKFVSAETKAKSSTIVVNKYEIAENALEIMSKICSPKNEDDFGQYFYELDEILWPEKGETFKKFVDDYEDFINFVCYFEDIKTALASHENTNATQVVVAGAFSSGKSTFLNTILGHNGLLPTDTDAASIVNTFIYCSKNIKKVSVKGVNLKNVLVQLDTDVLQCIQHSSKSNVYLASVLEKLIIEYPANERTNGLSFIDTPGYNNSGEKNASNGRTDKETAMQALKEGDVLFWLVEIGDGTVVSTGKEMINLFLDNNKDGKVVIIFNKADKKNCAEMESIVQAAAMDFDVSQDSRFIDVIAYSSSDTKIFYSFKGYSLEQVFEKARSCSTGYSEVQKIMKDVETFFNDNIEYHAEERTKWAKKLLEKKKEKNKVVDFLDKIEKEQREDIEWLSDMILTSYSDVMDAGKCTYNVASEFHDNVVDCLNNGLFMYGSAQWGDGDDYEKAVDRMCDYVNGFMKKLNGVYKFEYYREDNRKTAVETIKETYKKVFENYQTEYDKIRSDIDDYQLNVEIEKEYIEKWSDYKDRIVNALEKGIAKANAAKKKTQDPKAGKEYDQPLDIFQAILGNDYSLFENCFTQGVSISKDNCNPEGYTPLTYAVKTGQNNMVQFFIAHDADLKEYDKRGYNAIQTAVENNYKDICQILLDYDPSLAYTKSERGEDLMTIARKNTFENWLSKNI